MFPKARWSASDEVHGREAWGCRTGCRRAAVASHHGPIRHIGNNFVGAVVAGGKVSVDAIRDTGVIHRERLSAAPEGLAGDGPSAQGFIHNKLVEVEGYVPDIVRRQ